MSLDKNERLGIPTATQEFFENVKNTSVIVAPSKSPDETAVYRSALFPNELHKDFPGLKTMEDIFHKTLKEFPNNPFLGTRYPSIVDGQIVWSDYKFKTFKEFHTDRTQFGAGVKSLCNETFFYMGIFSPNRYEWVCSEMGMGCYGIPSVALYDTLGKDAAKFIINHAQVPVICAAFDKVPILLEMASECPTMKLIVVFEPLIRNPSGLDVLLRWGKQVNVKIVTFEQVIELGRKNPIPFAQVKADDIIALQYTSGTTGDPKGAMLTHQNIVSYLRSNAGKLPLDQTDSFLSYLPLAHIMERCAIASTVLSGAKAGFFRGDIALLIEDIQTLKPTIFVTVPRLLNRIYDKILQQALHAGGLKSKLFQKALNAKLYYLKEQKLIEHSVYDRLVFRKVRAALGGNVRAIITGSAPISSNILAFFRVCFSCQVLEGYGQTESTGGVTLSYPFDYTHGHVGAVSSNSEIKLVSVPDMNYHAKDRKGEIWIRGPSVFKGYLKDPVKTAETLTTDGWLKTGDIGSIDNRGNIFIIDRKKNIFKLAQGEYVAPEKLENIYTKSFFIAQMYVHGDSLQSELVAVVVPDLEYCVQFAMENGWLPSNTAVPAPAMIGDPAHPLMLELIKNPKLKQVIQQDLIDIAKQESLAGFEYIRGFHLEPELFSPATLLTPTFKLKRGDALKKYRIVFDELYKELSARPTKSKL